jgi:hypothetical protein
MVKTKAALFLIALLRRANLVEAIDPEDAVEVDLVVPERNDVNGNGGKSY